MAKILKPLNKRAFIKPDEIEKEKKVGTFIVQNDDKNHVISGTVIETDTDLVKPKDVVYFPSFSDKITIGKDEYYLVHESDIIAVK